MLVGETDENRINKYVIMPESDECRKGKKAEKGLESDRALS